VTARYKTTMIARIWRGWTSAADADEYVGYLNETGLKEYRETPGNQGAWLLRRVEGDRAEFLTLTFWADMEAVRRFAGDQPERAVYYPEDERFLVEHEDTVSHYELIE
jgi:heme-degrading monooxygenase HmoA